MSNGIRFPANSVLDWYTEVELMLIDFLKYVPYCDVHKQVWSPKLVIVLQETCSQLDSLWRWETVNVHNRTSRETDITDYFELYGKQMAPRWVVFWADEPKKIESFIDWQRANKFSKCEYSKYPLDWWTEGYNKIKHNRLENRTCASLKYAVDALAGLFLAIIRSKHCWDTLWERHWMSWDDCVSHLFNPVDCLKEDFEWINGRKPCNAMHMAIESKLFTYPVGLCRELFTANKSFPNWKGNCTHRFKAWYYKYCQSCSEEATST